MAKVIKNFGCGVDYCPGSLPEKPCLGCGTLFKPHIKDQKHPHAACRWKKRDRLRSAQIETATEIDPDHYGKLVELFAACGDPDDLEATALRLNQLAAAIRKAKES